MKPPGDKSARWFVAAIVSGYALLLITKVYQSFVFLPRHHGSFREAWGRLVDFSGFVAFVKSGPGLLLCLATAACFAAAALIRLYHRMFRRKA